MSCDCGFRWAANLQADGVDCRSPKSILGAAYGIRSASVSTTERAAMRIVRLATVPFFMLHHLRSQIDATAAAGHEVMLVASPVEGADALERIAGTRFVPIDVPRGIAPLRDLAALVSMYRLFRSFRPDVVHSTTPKAGLLCRSEE